MGKIATLALIGALTLPIYGCTQPNHLPTKQAVYPKPICTNYEPQNLDTAATGLYNILSIRVKRQDITLLETEVKRLKDRNDPYIALNTLEKMTDTSFDNSEVQQTEKEHCLKLINLARTGRED